VATVNPPVTRPVKGFKKVFLQPAESKKVTTTLDRRSLAYYDVSAHACDVAARCLRNCGRLFRLRGSVLNLFPAQLLRKSVMEQTYGQPR
jgi:Fibronectin type III-like domain